jgi:hypothetical protein
MASKTMHPALRIAVGHLLVKDAAPGGHPLHVARAELPTIAQAVAVLDGAGQDVGNRLDATMGMPRETRQIVSGPVATKVIEQQERIEVARVTETKPPMQMNPGAFQSGLRLHDSLYWTN